MGTLALPPVVEWMVERWSFITIQPTKPLRHRYHRYHCYHRYHRHHHCYRHFQLYYHYHYPNCIFISLVIQQNSLNEAFQ